MGIALTTAGVTLGYAVEETAGTRPTTGYTLIPDITSTPDFNTAPEQLDTTTLSATKFKTSTEGLKDLGGAAAFEANHTDALDAVWSGLVKAYENAKASGKAVWFEIKHPTLEKSVCFTGNPSKMGLSAMGVNSVLKTTLYVTVTNEPDWYTKSTASAS